MEIKIAVTITPEEYLEKINLLVSRNRCNPDISSIDARLHLSFDE
jgi:hypothetical protein